MADQKNEDELSATEKAQAENAKLDFYDEVDADEHARSAENTSVPDRASRDLWQSTNVATDGSGPQIHEVAPVFAEARANALAHPVTADDDDDAVRSAQADEAQAAYDRAEEIRSSAGYVAPTGAEAGQYSDPAHEGAVPDENYNPAPKDDEDEADGSADNDADDSVTVDHADNVNHADNVDNADHVESTPEAPTSNE